MRNFVLFGVLIASCISLASSHQSSRPADIICSDGRNRFEIRLFERDVVLTGRSLREPHTAFQASLAEWGGISVVASGPDIDESPLLLTVPTFKPVRDSLSKLGVIYPRTDEDGRGYVEARIPLAYNGAQRTSAHGEALTIRFNLIRSGERVDSYSVQLKTSADFVVVPDLYRGHSCRTRANLLP